MYLFILTIKIYVIEQRISADMFNKTLRNMENTRISLHTQDIYTVRNL